MRQAIETVIIPSVTRIRTVLLAQQAKFHGRVVAPDRSKRIILTFDGEREYLDATLDIVVDSPPPALAAAGIELFKFAASASKHQQPCDVAVSFMVLKQLARKLDDVIVPWWAADVERLLLGQIQASSARTFSDFLGRLPCLLFVVFTAVNIQRGWQQAGVYPLNIELIMQRCTTFSQLSGEQGKAVMESSEVLADAAKYTGEISDEAVQLAIGDEFDFEQWMAACHEKYKTPVTPQADLSLNRRRCIWLNHSSVPIDRRHREAERVTAEEAAEAAKVERELVKESRKREKEERKRAKAERDAAREAKQHAQEIRAAAIAAARAGKAPKATKSGRSVRLPTKLASK
jgi:hypothetical protein